MDQSIETVTTFVDNGNGTYTYTSEDGTVTTGGGSDNLGNHTAIQDVVLGTHGISDVNSELGTPGQILSSTGTGTDWVDSDAKGVILHGNTTQTIPHNQLTDISSYAYTVRNDFPTGSVSGGNFTVPAAEGGWFISPTLSIWTLSIALPVFRSTQAKKTFQLGENTSPC